ncbi:MAG: hypothetical protein ACLFTI_05480 [Anaerolineales bacterium]
MQIGMLEEAHNEVVWEVKRPVLRLELGLLAGLALFDVVVAFSFAPLRWWMIGGVSAFVVAIGLLLMWQTPAVMRGHLERTPTGGKLNRSRRRLVGKSQVMWEIPLDHVVGFRMEARTFEETSGVTYNMARLWVILSDEAEDDALLLTGWGPLKEIRMLGASLAKAGRRPFEPAATSPATSSATSSTEA